MFRLVASAALPQAMPCRLNAAKSAAACGVPFARLPSSSSATRMPWYHEDDEHESELGRAQV
ncbi:MAG: hypothetical protein HC882_04490 [Acidobacteria bacterium]|nr:hypothetical protein [Acidobacteriota bacterium]